MPWPQTGATNYHATKTNMHILYLQIKVTYLLFLIPVIYKVPTRYLHKDLPTVFLILCDNFMIKHLDFDNPNKITCVCVCVCVCV